MTIYGTNMSIPAEEEEEESKIVFVHDPDTNTTTRWGHLLGLQGLTISIAKDGQRQVLDHLNLNTLSVYLAWRQIQERKGDILPHLPALLEGCNFQWSLELRDSQKNPAEAVRQLWEATTTNVGGASRDDGDVPIPFAFYGTQLSSETIPLALLGEALQLPQVTGTATAIELDQRQFFARTVHTNAADAQAIMAYYRHVLGVTHVAAITSQDLWGEHFGYALREYADQYHVDLLSVSYKPDPTNHTNMMESMDSALEQIMESQYRYIFVASQPSKERVPLFIMAHQKGIMGLYHDNNNQQERPDYVWMGAELGSPTQLNRTNPQQRDYAMALHGLGRVGIVERPRYERFEIAMQHLLQNTTDYIQRMTPQATLKPIFDKYSWPTTYGPGAGASVNHLRIFDAVIALGVAACQTNSTHLFTPSEFFQQLLKVNFAGASGGPTNNVSFDAATGSRNPKSLQANVVYLRLSDELSDDEFFRFDSNVSVILTLDGQYQEDDDTDDTAAALIPQVEVINPFYYANNGTIPPPDIPPPPDHDYHLIPLGVQLVGYLLATLVVVLGVMCITWTVVARKTYTIRVAQPIFLIQLAVGVILAGLAIVPLSIPGAHEGWETSVALNVACMAPLWLIFIGFITAVSALFAKTWRMNKLMNSGQQMQRITVEAQEVIKPFVVSLVIHVVLLTCLTILAPFHFQRTPLPYSQDHFGRTTASYGMCRSSNQNLALGFLMPLALMDFLWLCMAVVQVYRARKLSTAFSESQYLTITCGALLETAMIGGPILLVTSNGHPTASYVVTSLILCACGLCVLLPIFLPKYIHRKIVRGNSAIFRETKSTSEHPPTSHQHESMGASSSHHNHTSVGTLGSINMPTTSISSHMEVGISNVGNASMPSVATTATTLNKGSSVVASATRQVGQPEMVDANEYWKQRSAEEDASSRSSLPNWNEPNDGNFESESDSEDDTQRSSGASKWMKKKSGGLMSSIGSLASVEDIDTTTSSNRSWFGRRMVPKKRVSGGKSSRNARIWMGNHSNTSASGDLSGASSSRGKMAITRRGDSWEFSVVSREKKKEMAEVRLEIALSLHSEINNDATRGSFTNGSRFRDAQNSIGGDSQDSNSVNIPPF